MKKTRILIIITVLTIIATIITCIIIYKHFTKDIKLYSSKEIFTQANYPIIDGSMTTNYLSNAFKQAFTKNTQNAIVHTGTQHAYERLINGKVELILGTQPNQTVEGLAKKAGIELEVIPVAREGFVFYINSNNPINNLTLEEVQKIYSGEITNWSEVGGENLEIEPYQCAENSDIQRDMENLVMKGKKLAMPLKENIKANETNITNLVSDFNNSENAIGYSYYNYATTVYDKSNLKILKINNIDANLKTIEDGTYPLITNYYIVVNKEKRQNSIIGELVDIMLSDFGQNVVREAGYVPLK